MFTPRVLPTVKKELQYSCNRLIIIAPQVGLEPTTP